jgi:AraC-like DNA-binding protein
MTQIARLPRSTPLPAPQQGSGVRVRNTRARSRYWRMMLRPLARPVPLEPLPPVGSGSDFALADLRVSKARFGACALVRDASTIEHSRFSSNVLVSLFLQGSLRGHSEGHGIELRRGDIGFFDLAHGGEFEASNASCLSLLVPRGLLRGKIHGLVLREADLPCKMLTKHLEQLVLSLPVASPRAESLAQSTLSVLQLCVDFAPPPSVRGATDPLRGSILAYIDANLEDPALAPDMLAEKFGISRTWLYRLFAGSGGISRCIRDKRLDAAFRDLCTSPERRIIDVAYHRGFSTERQFQRAFLQRFGSTPSEVRDRHKSGSPGSD